jgi:hypothetical protein
MKQENQNQAQPQERSFAAVAGVGALISVASSAMQYNAQKKAYKQQNAILDKTKGVYSQLRDLDFENLKNTQLQERNRNINVMNASGFDMGVSENRLMNFFDIKANQTQEMYNLETQQGLLQVETQRPTKPSATASILGGLSSGLSSFANLVGFGK